jgi:hypothetical protein
MCVTEIVVEHSKSLEVRHVDPDRTKVNACNARWQAKQHTAKIFESAGNKAACMPDEALYQMTDNYH